MEMILVALVVRERFWRGFADLDVVHAFVRCIILVGGSTQFAF